MTEELTVYNQLQPGELRTVTPMDLLQTAIGNNADLDKLEKLMLLQERWESNEARKAYVRAMASFKADPPTVIKTRTADFATSKGRTTYDYADLAGVAAIISKSLSRHGLSHSWRTEQNGKVIVTCTITHEMGHSESCSLSAEADLSGGKNSIQAIGSTISYLEKYTLLAVTGLAAQGQDDDGTAAEAPEFITPEQVETLKALRAEIKTSGPLFLKFMNVESIEQILAGDFKKAVNMLESKRAKERQPGEDG